MLINQGPAPTRNSLKGRRLHAHSCSIGIYPERDLRQPIAEDFVRRIVSGEYDLDRGGVSPDDRLAFNLVAAISASREGRALLAAEPVATVRDLSAAIWVAGRHRDRANGSGFYVPGVGVRFVWASYAGRLISVEGGLVTAEYHGPDMYLECPLWRQPIVGEECLYSGSKMLTRLREVGADVGEEINEELVDMMLNAGLRDDLFATRRRGEDPYRRELNVLEWLIDKGEEVRA